MPTKQSVHCQIFTKLLVKIMVKIIKVIYLILIALFCVYVPWVSVENRGNIKIYNDVGYSFIWKSPKYTNSNFDKFFYKCSEGTVELNLDDECKIAEKGYYWDDLQFTIANLQKKDYTDREIYEQIKKEIADVKTKKNLKNDKCGLINPNEIILDKQSVQDKKTMFDLSTAVPLMNYNKFAEKIKSKYPEYKDLDNKELAQKVIAKYPVYKEQVSFDSPQTSIVHDEKENNLNLVNCKYLTRINSIVDIKRVLLELLGLTALLFVFMVLLQDNFKKES